MISLYAAGNRYSYSNTGTNAINSGDVVLLVSGSSSGFIGIAVTAIAASTGTGELAIGPFPESVFTLTKNTGEAFTDGQTLYWDATNKRLTGTATSNTLAGRAFGTAASAATTANLLINRR